VQARPLESNPEQVGTLDSILARLKAERERLLRLYSDQERLAGVLATGHAVGQAEITRARMDTMQKAALGAAATQIQKGTRPFGTPDAAPAAASSSSLGSRTAAGYSSSAQGCSTCGMEYSIGGGP